ncbi:MAG TPA: sulfurtransferase [Candidatus Tyrphobacter sp.]
MAAHLARRLALRYTTIVSPEVLREHLGDPGWVVIDCRHNLQDFTAGRRSYEAGHIPGAFFADVERDLAGEKTGRNGRHPLPDPQRFADFLSSLGVRDDSQVVAYDEGADMYAARLWFLCRWIGHEAAAVLDGGIAAWRTLGYPIETRHAEPFDFAAYGGYAQDRLREQSERSRGTDDTLTVRLHPELLVTVDDVLADLESPAMRLLDARASDRFRGEIEPIDPVAGHIPGARNLWFKDNFDANGRLKSPEALRAMYAQHGSPAHVVHQCGSGISSAVNLLAMEYAGLPGSRLYNGSWSEWCSDPGRPIAKGE